MNYASIIHPLAFGMKLKSCDATTAFTMPGIQEVFVVNIVNTSYVRSFFDTATFPELIAVVGNSTSEVLQAKKSVNEEWENAPESTLMKTGFGGGDPFQVTVPEGLESTAIHRTKMADFTRNSGRILRKDGDPEQAFKTAAKVLERTYTAPFLAHNTMEPANCFAHITADQAVLYGATQWPDPISNTLSDSLGLPKEKIQINLARMGGGFGRRAYNHQMVEAALISQKANAPVMMVYTREDDMTSGVYRPTYSATYRAALDENNNLTAFHVKAGGIPETPIAPNRFPAGAIDNYLAEGWDIPSNITVGAFRAPGSNFIAGAEQSFLDELAEEMGKDPINFRLELLDRAMKNPVGERNDYDPERYAGVLKLVREKSQWDTRQSDVHRGVSAYFCHNSYVAEVLDIKMINDKPVVENVFAAVDCGIVVNPDAAANMGEGAIVDGIGNAFYGELTFQDGVPQKNNFNTYRMIRMPEAPKKIDVHFVKNEHDPTGLGEPLFPPIFAALANALYKSSGKRLYNQPFITGFEGENIRIL
jgi:isoquinoline 1-oxidoreductase beta subunit